MSGSAPSSLEPAPYTVRWMERDVLLCVPPESHAEREIALYCRSIEELTSRHDGPFAVISDGSSSRSIPGAKARRLYGEFTDRVRESGRHDCVLNVVVLRSALLRGALNALMWFVKNPAPTVVVASLDEGLWRAREALRARHRA